MSEPNKSFHSVNIFAADTTGCNWYRNYCPQLTIEHTFSDVLFNTCRRFNTDVHFFENTNVNILQRQVADHQCAYYVNFIIPMSRKCGSWIVYNIDDCIHKDDIPYYNNAWESFQSDKLMDNIRIMIQSSDFVLVTTDELGEYYVNRFGAHKDSIVVIPNYIPYWWMGTSFNYNNIIHSYEQHVINEKRPRIGLIGAPSHYDTKGRHVDNDITPILPYIKKTIKDFKWVIFGSRIPELDNFVRNGDIEYHDGVDVLQYPRVLSELNLQFIVAPLQDNIFNRCKSNIKLIESWALGFGCACQDLPTYNKYTTDVFSDEETLHGIITSHIKDIDTFSKMVRDNHDKMHEYWLENNLGIWRTLYTMRKKPMIYNYDLVEEKTSDNISIDSLTQEDK